MLIYIYYYNLLIISVTLITCYAITMVYIYLKKRSFKKPRIKNHSIYFLARYASNCQLTIIFQTAIHWRCICDFFSFSSSVSSYVKRLTETFFINNNNHSLGYSLINYRNCFLAPWLDPSINIANDIHPSLSLSSPRIKFINNANLLLYFEQKRFGIAIIYYPRANRYINRVFASVHGSDINFITTPFFHCLQFPFTR